MADLTADGFEKLLERLGEDKTQAAEKYEELRLKLIKYFVWRGVSNLFADNLADETLAKDLKPKGNSITVKISAKNLTAGEDNVITVTDNEGKRERYVFRLLK